MPELPEVETVTIALNQYLLNRKFISIKTHVEKLRYLLDLENRDEILKHPIVDIRRRAKYIIMEFDNQYALLIHLGMTGSWRLETTGIERQKHDHVEFFLTDNEVLRYNDPRRFGFILISKLAGPGCEPDELPVLAPEPLSEAFNLGWLQHVCAKSKKPIKNLLMDNAMVVGVGNIYASEALFRAGIRPTVPAARLTKPRLKKLHTAIVTVLREAIIAGGTTIQNFTSLNSQEGYFSRELMVYDRAGLLCLKCQKNYIIRTVVGGRSTFYCRVCQR
jgi:formamidopyrimidine-DNA glycosylase